MDYDYYVTRLTLSEELQGHSGCVNSIAWDDSGRYLCSGSDDKHINVYDMWSQSEDGTAKVNGVSPKHLVHRIKTGHQRNIFCVKFMDGQNAVISGDAEYRVAYTDINQYYRNNKSPAATFDCHARFVNDVIVDPLNPATQFFSCSGDGTVNLYDLRIRTSCNCKSNLSRERNLHCNRHTYIDVNVAPEYSGCECCDEFQMRPSKSAAGIDGTGESMFRSDVCSRQHGVGVTSMDVLQTDPVYIALGCTDSFVRVFDRRKLDKPVYRSSADSKKYQPSKKQVQGHSIDNFHLYPKSLDCYKGICYSFAPSHMRYGLSNAFDQYGVELDYHDRPILLPRNQLQQKYKDIFGGLNDESEFTSLFQKKVYEDDDSEYKSVASVKFDKTGRLAVSYQEDDIYLVDVMSTVLGQNVKYPRHEGAFTPFRGDKCLNQQNRMEALERANRAFGAGSVDATNEFLRQLRLQREVAVQDQLKQFKTSSNSLYLPLFDMKHIQQYDKDVLLVASGHINIQTMIKQMNFVPNYCSKQEDYNMICSGSDDGFIYGWKLDMSDKALRLEEQLPAYCWKGDKSITNGVVFNQKYPMMASCGIDSSIKVFQPVDGIASEVQKLSIDIKAMNQFQSGFVKSDSSQKYKSYSELVSEYQDAIDDLTHSINPQFQQNMSHDAILSSILSSRMDADIRVQSNPPLSVLNMFGVGMDMDMEEEEYNDETEEDEEDDEDEQHPSMTEAQFQQYLSMSGINTVDPEFELTHSAYVGPPMTMDQIREAAITNPDVLYQNSVSQEDVLRYLLMGQEPQTRGQRAAEAARQQQRMATLQPQQQRGGNASQRSTQSQSGTRSGTAQRQSGASQRAAQSQSRNSQFSGGQQQSARLAPTSQQQTRPAQQSRSTEINLQLEEEIFKRSCFNIPKTEEMRQYVAIHGQDNIFERTIDNDDIMDRLLANATIREQFKFIPGFDAKVRQRQRTNPAAFGLSQNQSSGQSSAQSSTNRGGAQQPPSTQSARSQSSNTSQPQASQSHQQSSQQQSSIKAASSRASTSSSQTPSIEKRIEEEMFRRSFMDIPWNKEIFDYVEAHGSQNVFARCMQNAELMQRMMQTQQFKDRYGADLSMSGGTIQSAAGSNNVNEISSRSPQSSAAASSSFKASSSNANQQQKRHSQSSGSRQQTASASSQPAARPAQPQTRRQASTDSPNLQSNPYPDPAEEERIMFEALTKKYASELEAEEDAEKNLIILEYGMRNEKLMNKMLENPEVRAALGNLDEYCPHPALFHTEHDRKYGRNYKEYREQQAAAAKKKQSQQTLSSSSSSSTSSLNAGEKKKKPAVRPQAKQQKSSSSNSQNKQSTASSDKKQQSNQNQSSTSDQQSSSSQQNKPNQKSTGERKNSFENNLRNLFK
ncbi:hypothetical protein MIR68_011444 [Amoeboaphelidium protococcarum]|nr:hypothetical protein MIR68_011444 [Amoeboaphelidium protococcarum]